MSLEAVERQTIIDTDDSVGYWTIYTCQGKIMTKIEKLGVEPYQVEKDKEGNIAAKYYKLDFKQVSFRKLIKLSEEEREKRKQTMLQNKKLAKIS
ncbi:TPA: hypothetical protein PTV74_003337 [Clostridium botulinum]|nr:hypothetical protein [Clostridium botulinum]HDK7206492.1 hypothetical protein [Clostridium botulinum]HDK7210227.1 hypothetical protein [Clostridium botulinum]HDK7265677.1 hypothetical protein [Clostridium botulinum]HDK7269524.1 hypothetical protein [Clostridium botulinum]